MGPLISGLVLKRWVILIFAWFLVYITDRYLVTTQLQWVIPFWDKDEQVKYHTQSLTAHDVLQWPSGTGTFVTPKAHISNSNHWFYLVPNMNDNKNNNPLFYATNELYWKHLMFGFSLQHCFKDCKGNIKLTSKPSAHQHFISFALISSHIGKVSICLSEYLDIWDLKHARICDILSAAKKFLCTLTG